MVDIPTIETARLRLRAFRNDDFEAYADMWTEPAVVRHFGEVAFSRETTWGRFLRQVGLWHHLGFGGFAIEHRETGAFIGETGFRDMRRDVTPSLEGTMELGWVLRSGMHGQGFATEAAQAAIDWAAEHGKGDRITCMIVPGNGGSLRVAAKLAFVEFARTEYGGKPVILLERARVI